MPELRTLRPLAPALSFVAMTRDRVFVRFCSLLLFFAAIFLALQSQAQSDAPAPANLAARTWFQDAKFGMFIHWGVYSVLGDGEWVMDNRKMPITEYEKLPAALQPGEIRRRRVGRAGQGRRA